MKIIPCSVKRHQTFRSAKVYVNYVNYFERTRRLEVAMFLYGFITHINYHDKMIISTGHCNESKTLLLEKLSDGYTTQAMTATVLLSVY